MVLDSSLRQIWSAVTCYRFSRSRLVATHPGAAPSRRVTKRRRVAALQTRALPHGRATAPRLPSTNSAKLHRHVRTGIAPRQRSAQHESGDPILTTARPVNTGSFRLVRKNEDAD